MNLISYSGAKNDNDIHQQGSLQEFLAKKTPHISVIEAELFIRRLWQVLEMQL